MIAQYRCGSERRRQAVRDADPPTVNGIDFLEVAPDHTVLTVTFLHDLPGSGSPDAVPPAPSAKLTVKNVAVEGGVRIRDIEVQSVTTAGNALTVTVDRQGDFSTYRLRLRRDRDDDRPPAKFDPQLSEVSFSFRADCPSDFDCPGPQCPHRVFLEPEIDYLAKDYESFRRLMLDRLAAIMPQWQERNPADLGIALVELLAHSGDLLSYAQDSAATEAYLGTARRRPSVRRHARLLDYHVHEGCSARAWICFEVEAGGTADGLLLDPGTTLLTGGSVGGAVIAPDDLTRALDERPEVFQTLHPVTLRAARNGLEFHTWSDEECCLPAGATRATLRRPAGLTLAPGEVLVLDEVRSPTTGVPADADPDHRHPVRLTSAVADTDPLDGTPIVEVAWSPEDALPFPLCVSALVPDPSGTKVMADVSVARANVVLADHGRTVAAEPLDPSTVPEGIPYRPRLRQRPLSFRGPLDVATPASAATRWDPADASPAVKLSGEGATWTPRYDLLGSDRFETEFVVEMENDRTASLRFGDDERGRRPQPGAQFSATYLVGGGRAGNVGAGAISRMVHDPVQIDRVWNPLPAVGGVDPEPLERVRHLAPQAFRTQERAVTEADYTEVAGRHPGIQRATARMRWTGSWYTAFVTADRTGGLDVDAPFEAELTRFLDRYRMAGVDMEVEGPVTVPMDLALEVCVKPGFMRSDVAQELLEVLGSRVGPGGRRAFFHPDNFTFGQPVYLSQIYGAAMDVSGVRSIVATRFQRWGKAPNQELELEVLAPGAMEIVRLDNDPNFPENGRLELSMEGGL